MENNKEQAIIIETNEVFTVKSKQSKFGIELRVPPELEHITHQMMSENSFELDTQMVVEMVVEMYYDESGELKHKTVKQADPIEDDTIYQLSNGEYYKGSELVVGLENIRDYKLKQLNKL